MTAKQGPGGLWVVVWTDKRGDRRTTNPIRYDLASAYADAERRRLFREGILESWLKVTIEPVKVACNGKD